MLDLIHMGGPLFMWPLVLLLAAVLLLTAWTALDLVKGQGGTAPDRRLDLILHIGLFAAVFGVLGQALGLYQAMEVIESVGGVSPALLAGGLKVSFVPTLFGLADLTIALAAWTCLRWFTRRHA